MKRRAFLKAATAVAASSIAPAWLISTKLPGALSELPGTLSIALIQRGGDEATYHGYRRIAAPRNAATWSVDGTEATNKIKIGFPECSGNGQEITGVGICIGSDLVFVGDLTASFYVDAGWAPEFLPGHLDIPLSHTYA